MDFNLGEELEAVRDLAGEIFADHATAERVRTVEGSDSRVDEQLWAHLAEAGLLGIALPERDGGSGLGLGALCVLLEEQGRCVAPVPLWAATVGALALAAHGTAQQRRELLPATVDGSSRLTMALEEFGPHEPGEPECTAREQGSGWQLTGTKAAVPSPGGADRVLVAASTDSGTGLFLVDTGAAGVSWQWAETTSRDLSANLVLDGAPAQAVGAPGARHVLDRTIEHARVALSALQAGVAQGALRHGAAYLSEREQFGRPLATFQAVQHQLADCYIEIEAMRVCLWQAVCGIEEEVSAEAAVLVATWWAGNAGLNVVHRIQHVHGGIGVDTDYPVHRYFLWGKQLSSTLGGSGADLARLGGVLADEKVDR